MRCDTCLGYFPPFDRVDQMIYEKWTVEKEAEMEARLDSWKRATQ